MGQKIKKQKQGSTILTEENGQMPTKKWAFSGFAFQAAIVCLISLIFYGNTIQNGFAFDDRPIIVDNIYVRQGIAGIPGIFTSDAFESYLQQRSTANALTGGRYRPLSIATFAIEQQFFGHAEKAEATSKSNAKLDEASSDDNDINDLMHIRHVVNVLLYALSGMVLLYFLRKYLFPGNHLIAFVATILFLIHPIHTEVVANVKSRDEIMSLLFILTTFIFGLRYKDSGKRTDLYVAMTSYLLALLSKEYALSLLVLLPLLFYTVRKDTLKNSLKSLLPYLLPFGVYLLLRQLANTGGKAVIADNMLNLPYLYATSEQKFASIVSELLVYVKMLFVPHPLACDYSYSAIPYRSFSSPIFCESALLYLGVVSLFFYLVFKRNILGFALGFFLVHLFLISNIAVNIGAPFGERLIYHSSLGFAIIIGCGLCHLCNRILPAKFTQMVVLAVLLIVTTASAYATINRNKAWKNDNTLFLTDVETVGQSCKVLANAGAACIDVAAHTTDTAAKQGWYSKGISYLDRSIHIYPQNTVAYKNRGICFYKMGLIDRAVADWDTVAAHDPTAPGMEQLRSSAGNTYFLRGMQAGKTGNHAEAIRWFLLAAPLQPNNEEIWVNIGIANYALGKNDEALSAFAKAVKLAPGNVQIRKMYDEFSHKVYGTNNHD